MLLNFACWTSDRPQKWGDGPFFIREGSLYPLDLFTSLVQQHPSGTGRGEFQSPGKRKLHPGFLLLLWHNLRLPSAPRGDNLWFSFCTNEAPFVPMERTCRGWIQLIMWSSQDDNFTVGLQFVPLVILFLSSLGESGKQHREGYCLKGVYVIFLGHKN